jgi:hypothetical protein
MAIQIYPYDITLQRFFSGVNQPSSLYRVNLYSTFVFNGDATTKAAAEVGCTQLPTALGYVQNAQLLTGVVVNQDGNGCMFDANDVSWLATGGNLAAAGALVFNDSTTGDEPVVAIPFGTTKIAPDTTNFPIIWPNGGIIQVTTPNSFP